MSLRPWLALVSLYVALLWLASTGSELESSWPEEEGAPQVWEVESGTRIAVSHMGGRCAVSINAGVLGALRSGEQRARERSPVLRELVEAASTRGEVACEPAPWEHHGMAWVLHHRLDPDGGLWVQVDRPWRCAPDATRGYADTLVEPVAVAVDDAFAQRQEATWLETRMEVHLHDIDAEQLSELESMLSYSAWSLAMQVAHAPGTGVWHLRSPVERELTPAVRAWVGQCQVEQVRWLHDPYRLAPVHFYPRAIWKGDTLEVHVVGRPPIARTWDAVAPPGLLSLEAIGHEPRWYRPRPTRGAEVVEWLLSG